MINIQNISINRYSFADFQKLILVPLEMEINPLQTNCKNYILHRVYNTVSQKSAAELRQ